MPAVLLLCADGRGEEPAPLEADRLGHGAVPWPNTMKNPCKSDVGFVHTKVPEFWHKSPVNRTFLVTVQSLWSGERGEWIAAGVGGDQVAEIGE